MSLHRPQFIVLVLIMSTAVLNAGRLEKSKPGTLKTRSGREGDENKSRRVRSLRANVEELKTLKPLPNSAAAGGDTAQSLLSKSLELLSGGKYESVGGIESVWQLPPASTTRRGVLFIAHGCNHGAIDWWPQSTSCPQCIGLPEEMNVTLHSLLRGYAVVTVSSSARQGSRCWQNAFSVVDEDYSQEGGQQVDWMRVKTVLDTVLPREGLASLPLFAMGCSSGGAFVLGLPSLMPGVFKGIAAQIGGARPGWIQQYRKLGSSTREPFPPTMFVHMPRDQHLASLVEGNLKELRGEGLPTTEIQVLPQPLTPLYLAQRCAPEIDEPTSKAIYEAFRAAGDLDPRGYLLQNSRGMGPRSWRSVLKKAKIPGLDKLRLQADVTPLGEELNLLWAGHELSSETTTDMLNWLESATAAGAGAGKGTE